MSNDFFGFDDPHYRSTDLSAADDKTLRLAMVPLTEEELAGLKRFQQTYLAHAEPARGNSEALATAHRDAMKASGMPEKRVEQGLALLRLFSGKRWTVQKLRAKLTQLESAGPEKDELREKIHDELDRLERDTQAMARRFGQETLDLLRRHEPELLALHTRLTEVLSRA